MAGTASSSAEVSTAGASSASFAANGDVYTHGIFVSLPSARLGQCPRLAALVDTPNPWGELHITLHNFAPALSAARTAEVTILLNTHAAAATLQIVGLSLRRGRRSGRTNLCLDIESPDLSRIAASLGQIKALGSPKLEAEAAEPHRFRATLAYGSRLDAVAVAELERMLTATLDAEVAAAGGWEISYVRRGENSTTGLRDLLFTSSRNGVRRYLVRTSPQRGVEEEDDLFTAPFQKRSNTPFWIDPIDGWLRDGVPVSLLGALPRTPKLPPPAELDAPAATLRSSDFLLEDHVAFLNHGSYGATLRCAIDAAVHFRSRFESEPVRWMEDEVLPLLCNTITSLAQLVRCAPLDLVLVPNATSACNSVIRSLANEMASSASGGDGSVGRNAMLCLEYSYGAIVSTMAHATEQRGGTLVRLKVRLPFDLMHSQEGGEKNGDDGVGSENGENSRKDKDSSDDSGFGATSPAASSFRAESLPLVQRLRRALEAMCTVRGDKRTCRVYLAVLDWVTSCPAAVLPIEAMASAAKEFGCLVLVDGAHGVGTCVDIDIHRLERAGVDALATNCHKWLCAPKGTALLWCRRALQKHIHPTVISHGYGVSFASEFIWQASEDHSRYLALNACLAWFRSRFACGVDGARARCHALVLAAAEMLAAAWETRTLFPSAHGVAARCCPCLAVVQLPRGRYSAASCAADGARELCCALRAESIEVPVFPFAATDARGGATMTREPELWVRLSAQVYNEMSDYVRLRDAVLRLQLSPPLPESGGEETNGGGYALLLGAESVESDSSDDDRGTARSISSLATPLIRCSFADAAAQKTFVELATWVRSHGGYVDERVECIARGGHGDRTLWCGPCSVGTELIRIPLELCITPSIAATATEASVAVASDARCCATLDALGANVLATVHFALLILSGQPTARGGAFEQRGNAQEDAAATAAAVDSTSANGAVSGSSSFWLPYRRSLPSLHALDSAMLLWGRAAAARHVGDLALRLAVRRERGAIDLAYRAICRAYPPLAAQFSSRHFARATVLATSRCFALDDVRASGGALVAPPTATNTPALVPLADLMNHSPARRCAAWNYDVRRRCFTVTTLRAVVSDAGEELCCSYGRKTAAELLCSYGFILSPRDVDPREGSPDSVPVFLRLCAIARQMVVKSAVPPPAAARDAMRRDVLWERARKTIAAAARTPTLDETAELRLVTPLGEEKDVLDAVDEYVVRCDVALSPFAEGTRAALALMRIAVADGEELHREGVDWGVAVSRRNEVAVLRQIAIATGDAVDAAVVELNKLAASADTARVGSGGEEEEEEEEGGAALEVQRASLGKAYAAACAAVATHYERIADAAATMPTKSAVEELHLKWRASNE